MRDVSHETLIFDSGCASPTGPFASLTGPGLWFQGNKERLVTPPNLPPESQRWPQQLLATCFWRGGLTSLHVPVRLRSPQASARVWTARAPMHGALASLGFRVCNRFSAHWVVGRPVIMIGRPNHPRPFAQKCYRVSFSHPQRSATNHPDLWQLGFRAKP